MALRCDSYNDYENYEDEHITSEQYDRDCNCNQCLSRRRIYLKMVIANLRKVNGWAKAINRHDSELRIIEERLHDKKTGYD